MSTPAQANKQRTGRRTWLGLLIPALLLFAVLVALGTWQLQRKAWKEDLIATLTQRLAAPPSALPAPSTWPQPRSGRATNIAASNSRAQFETGNDALVLATASAFRPDVSGLGYWVFTPARLADGSLVMVNRGFVPTKLRRTRMRSMTARFREPSRSPASCAGRTPGNGSRRATDPAQNVWFVRDPATIAAAKDWGPVPPFYVEQESPVPPGGWPQPGKIVVNLAQQPPAIRRDLVRPGARSGCGFRRLGPSNPAVRPVAKAPDRRRVALRVPCERAGFSISVTPVRDGRLVAARSEHPGKSITYIARGSRRARTFVIASRLDQGRSPRARLCRSDARGPCPRRRPLCA